MNRFQRIVLRAFICLEALIFIGAIVRATESGLGCPDWPFCYGCWVPPSSADKIDFTKLNIEKFKAKAAQYGRDPNTITPETLRAEYNPVATWIEYSNRLSSIPVSLSVLAMLVASFGQIPGNRRNARVAVWMAFALLLVNAWLGKRVVQSGLNPSSITWHMAAAILMQCVIVYAAWVVTEKPWRFRFESSRPLKIAAVLFGLVIAEGIMGSQVRQMTDYLAAQHYGHSRSEWVHELEQSWVYLVHRSFSWLILGLALVFGKVVKKARGELIWLDKGIIGLVFAQMCLGVVLAQIGVFGIAQVLHIGLSSLLVSGLFLFVLAARKQV